MITNACNMGLILHTGFSRTLLLVFLLAIGCQKKTGNANLPPNPGVPAMSDVAMWMTKGDESVLLQKQNLSLVFGSSASTNTIITIDTTQVFQSIDGFGYTLTGGSANVINRMNTTERDALLQEL